MTARSRVVLVLVAVVTVLLGASPASAHPLGNFTVNTFAAVEVSPGQARVRYVLDLAEIPAFQELERIGDGVPNPAELATWARTRAEELGGRLTLSVDGTDVPMTVVSAHAERLPGQGGLPVLRLEAVLFAPIPGSGQAVFVDGNLPGRIGWREIVVTASTGIVVEHSSAPASSVSEELRSYPDDLLSSPLDVTRATFSFRQGSESGVTSTGAAGGAQVRTGGQTPPTGGLAGALASPLAPFALVLAFGFGALHALGPGHGKTLVAAYLVGSSAHLRHAVAAGVAVAAMHSASAIVLGIAIAAADRTFAPERTYPWLGTLAGLAAAAVGARLLVARLRAGRTETPGGADDEVPRAHHHAAHAHDHGDAHPHPHPADGLLSARGIVSLALAGGVVPSPTALVTLLASMAAGRIGMGLALVAAFSVGLATTLVAVGALALRTREALGARLGRRWSRVVALGSAATILVAGVVMSLRALASL